MCSDIELGKIVDQKQLRNALFSQSNIVLIINEDSIWVEVHAQWFRALVGDLNHVPLLSVIKLNDALWLNYHRSNLFVLRETVPFQIKSPVNGREILPSEKHCTSPLAIRFFEHGRMQFFRKILLAVPNEYASELILAADVGAPYAGVGACVRVSGFNRSHIVSCPRKCTNSSSAARPRQDVVLKL